MAARLAPLFVTLHFLTTINVCRQDGGGGRARDQSTVSESSRRFRAEFLEDWPQQPGAPYFDPTTPANVTGLVGHEVTLLCKVKNLQNRTVGVVGPSPRHPPADGGPVHVHVGPALRGAAQAALRGVGPAHPQPAAPRLRPVRVPDLHHAAHRTRGLPQYCGTRNRNTGRAGPVHIRGLDHQSNVHRAAHARAAALHHVDAPRQDNKLRLDEGRHLAGDRERCSQQQLSAGAGGAHQRRGRLRVRARQRQVRHCEGPRTHRRDPGGDARRRALAAGRPPGAARRLPRISSACARPRPTSAVTAAGYDATLQCFCHANI